MKVSLDGKDLCITFDDFKNLQESPAFFVELTEEQIKEFEKFNSCPNWGEKVLSDGISVGFGSCGKCGWCKEHEND